MKLQRSSWLFVLLLAAVVVACTPSEPSESAPADEEAAPTAEAAEAPSEEAAAEEEPEQVQTHEITTAVEMVDGVRSLVATITPMNGYKVNLEFPWNLSVRDDAPVAAGTRQGNGDAAMFEEAAAKFVIPADGAEAGEVLADLRLGVCDETGCITPREELAWNLAAAE